MDDTYCNMPKDTYRAEVTSNSEKIKPKPFEIGLSEIIGQAVSLSVNIFFFNLIATFESISGIYHKPQ